MLPELGILVPCQDVTHLRHQPGGMAVMQDAPSCCVRGLRDNLQQKQAIRIAGYCDADDKAGSRVLLPECCSSSLLELRAHVL